MGADEDLVARFWHGYRNSADGREAIALHPHLKHFTDEDFKYTVPCVLHEDAGPYSKNRSCDIVSWSSLTGRGSDLMTKYVHHTELKHSGLDPTSAQASWDAFFQDFDSLAYGIDPETGEHVVCATDGVPWRFVLIHGKSDLEQALAWDVILDYNGGDEICGYCNCNRTTRPFTDLRVHAASTASIGMSNDQFLARLTGNHPVRRSHYCNKYFYRFDAMHLYEVQGCANIIAGGVIDEVIRTSHALGPTMDLRLEKINTLKDEWYGNHVVHSKIPLIKKDNLYLGEGAGPKRVLLKGKMIKAAALRHLMPFIELLADTYLTASVEHGRIRRLVASMNAIYDSLYSTGMFFTPDELAVFQTRIARLGKYWMACNADALAKDSLRFGVIPKVHYQTHLAQQARLINPRYVQVYAEESLVGKITSIWGKSCAGPYFARVQYCVMLKYVLLTVLLHDL